MFVEEGELITFDRGAKTEAKMLHRPMACARREGARRDKKRGVLAALSTATKVVAKRAAIATEEECRAVSHCIGSVLRLRTNGRGR